MSNGTELQTRCAISVVLSIAPIDLYACHAWLNVNVKLATTLQFTRADEASLISFVRYSFDSATSGR